MRYVRIAPPTVIIIPQATPFPASYVAKQGSSRSLFVFDPNTIDSLAFDSLDLPRWIKKNMLKYRRSGGVFCSKDEIRKVYGITDSIFAEIEPYLAITPCRKAIFSKKPASFRHDKTRTKARPAPIELNNAECSDLLVPHLIGQKRSEAIMKYRDKLGGFYTLSQLSEIYVIGDSLLPEIIEYFTVDTASIVKKNLCDQTWAMLIGHPYIDNYTAKHILQARKISPEIKTVVELSRAKVIDSATHSKLKHYFN